MPPKDNRKAHITERTRRMVLKDAQYLQQLFAFMFEYAEEASQNARKNFKSGSVREREPRTGIIWHYARERAMESAQHVRWMGPDFIWDIIDLDCTARGNRATVRWLLQMWTRLRKRCTRLLDWACAAQEDTETVAIGELVRAIDRGCSLPVDTFAMQAFCS